MAKRIGNFVIIYFFYFGRLTQPRACDYVITTLDWLFFNSFFHFLKFKCCEQTRFPPGCVDMIALAENTHTQRTKSFTFDSSKVTLHLFTELEFTSTHTARKGNPWVCKFCIQMSSTKSCSFRRQSLCFRECVCGWGRLHTYKILYKAYPKFSEHCKCKKVQHAALERFFFLFLVTFSHHHHHHSIQLKI